MTGNPIFNEAFKRALGHGCLLGGLAFMGARQQGINWENSIYAFIGAVVALLVSRGVFERADTGNMNASDVPMASPKVEVVPTGSVGDITVTGSVASTSGTN
jgi:hypothetical protein